MNKPTTPTHYAVKNGVAEYVNPLSINVYPTLSEDFDDEDYIDAIRLSRWRKWQQSEYFSFRATALTHDGQPVKDGVYPVEAFKMKSICILGDRCGCPIDGCDNERTVIYLKQEAVEQENVQYQYKNTTPLTKVEVAEAAANSWFNGLSEPDNFERCYQACLEVMNMLNADHLIQQGYKSQQEVEAVVSGRIEFWQNKVEKHPDTAWIFKPFVEELEHILNLLKKA